MTEYHRVHGQQDNRLTINFPFCILNWRFDGTSGIWGKRQSDIRIPLLYALLNTENGKKEKSVGKYCAETGEAETGAEDSAQILGSSETAQIAW